jgi:thioredoxin 2
MIIQKGDNMDKVQVVCPHCLQINRVPKKEHYSKANCGKCKNSLLDNKPVDVNAQEFQHIITNSDLPVVVDFWAPWCGPCRMMAPAFADAAQKLPLKAQFVKVNTEENQQLSAQFGIRSIPTMAILKNGQEVDRVSGALPAQNIIEWVSRFI